MPYQNGGDARFTRSYAAEVAPWEHPATAHEYDRSDRRFRSVEDEWTNYRVQQAFGYPATRIENYPAGNSYAGLMASGYNPNRTFTNYRPVQSAPLEFSDDPAIAKVQAYAFLVTWLVMLLVFGGFFFYINVLAT